MPEISGPLLIGALVLFVLIAVVLVKVIPRVMGRQCPSCLRRVPKGETTCPACGSAVVR
jgi:hypothetical protein